MVSNWAVHLMKCLDCSKLRSVIGTLVATEDGQRLIAFFNDEFDLDMNFHDPAWNYNRRRIYARA